MVRSDTAVRRLLREMGKLLQPYGFEGTEPTWVRVAAGGVASVGRTRVSRSWSGGRQEIAFGLAVNATPTAWWEFCNWRNAQLGVPTVPLAAASGPGLLGAEALPDELTRMWTLRSDARQPGQHVLQDDIEAVRAELPRRVHAYARRALRLLEPDRYLDELSARPVAGGRYREAMVVLLAERGPGARLDAECEEVRRCFAVGDARAYAEQVIGYARARADGLMRAPTGDFADTPS
ncbi:hypothetical protein [Nocardia wallacei]|uniref:hypothetical protein n=1 Tax=Nocardia wallacei TaxID=480035 RepID=UPI00245434E1|nr:hypothetical protein [Nocardia wallacei]